MAIQNKTAIKYAKALKEYCKKRGDTCKGCPLSMQEYFYSANCVLRSDIPMHWRLKEGEAQ